MQKLIGIIYFLSWINNVFLFSILGFGFYNNFPITLVLEVNTQELYIHAQGLWKTQSICHSCHFTPICSCPNSTHSNHQLPVIAFSLSIVWGPKEQHHMSSCTWLFVPQDGHGLARNPAPQCWIVQFLGPNAKGGLCLCFWVILI